MNKKLFASMQEQLKPGPEVLDALERRLAAARPKRRPQWGRYVALAACLALVVAAAPAYLALNPPLHAYALGAVEELGDLRQEQDPLTGDRGNGIDGTHAVGQGMPMVERPVQEEATAAYTALMDRFTQDYGPGNYPDWYGGSYIDEWGGLIVCVVDAPAEDKSLYLEIQSLCGSDAVGFRDVQYTLTHLNSLQEQVTGLLQDLRFADQLWASGVDEENNRLSVVLPFASKKALAELHRLDPEGDAISVTVVERQAVTLTGPDTAPGGTEAPAELPPEGKEPADLPAPAEPGVAHYDLLEEPAAASLAPQN